MTYLSDIDRMCRQYGQPRGVSASTILEHLDECPGIQQELRNAGYNDGIDIHAFGKLLSSLEGVGTAYGHGKRNLYSAVPGTERVPRAKAMGNVASVGAGDSGVVELLKCTRKPITFARLCDVLDMAPTKVRRLVETAQERGYTVQVAGDDIAWHEPEPDSAEREIVAPVVGIETTVGVLSDTHFGSKYVRRDYIKDFVAKSYDAGARIILHAGDVLDGIYDHGRWELSHHGLEEQIEDCLTTLPRLDGLKYVFIDGNHDSTFWRMTGYPTGKAIITAAQREGRNDLEYVGARGAMLSIGGAKVELWHPKKSGAYSLSYHLQNHIRDMALGHKPDILLAGHWHTSVYVEQRGVHAFACGTFQGAGSEFSKSLGGAPSLGGWILSWSRTDHGTLRRLKQERISYYEHEAPREVA